MELILDSSVFKTEDNRKRLKDNIVNIYEALERYNNDYELTQVNNLKMSSYEDWKIIEQNPDKDSSLARLKKAGLDVANLIEDNYYGTVINDNIYVNVNFFTDYTVFKDRLNVRKCIHNIMNIRKQNRMVIGGVKIKYVTDIDDSKPFIMHWYNTRDHDLVLLDKINKFLKFWTNIA